MKRILIVSQNFYPEIGSGANRIKNLYLLLKEQGFNVHVLTTEPSYPNKKLFQDDKYWDNDLINNASDSEVIRLNMRHEKQKDCMKSRFYYYMEFMMKVHYFIKHSASHFDYIYLTSPNIFVPWGGMFFQPEIHGKSILEIRDLWPDSVIGIDKMNIKPFLPFLHLLENKMYNLADKIVVNNESFIPHIKQKLNKAIPIIYVPNGMMNNERILSQRFHTFSVVYTGNIGLAQNFSQIIELAVALEKNKIYFNIVPYGVHAANIREFVTQNGFKYVHVYKTIPRKECLEFISRHHLSLSILKENEVFLNVLPGKVIDAITMHVPVITNLDGPAHRIINEKNVGYAKPAATTEEIINAVLMYRNNESEWRQQMENTKQLSKDEFMWEHNIYKIIEIMR